MWDYSVIKYNKGSRTYCCLIEGNSLKAVNCLCFVFVISFFVLGSSQKLLQGNCEGRYKSKTKKKMPLKLYEKEDCKIFRSTDRVNQIEGREYRCGMKMICKETSFCCSSSMNLSIQIFSISGIVLPEKHW